MFGGLDEKRLIHFTTTGRRSGLPREKWWLPFAPDGDVLYLLEEHGTDAQWVRNVLADPVITVEDISATARVVTDDDEIAHARRVCAERFRRVGLVEQGLVERGLVVAVTASAVPSRT
ncbi:MAG TPA: nitroreductase/quinone reductase family protein [Acidimicrobiales bacterium]|nr:nitroreductase/quinone reductase family protein [Acidimicrobiales bacterium]